jgi:hypothetical protein
MVNKVLKWVGYGTGAYLIYKFIVKPLLTGSSIREEVDSLLEIPGEQIEALSGQTASATSGFLDEAMDILTKRTSVVESQRKSTEKHVSNAVKEAEKAAKKAVEKAKKIKLW